MELHTLNDHMWQIYGGYKAGFPLIAQNLALALSYAACALYNI